MKTSTEQQLKISPTALLCVTFKMKLIFSSRYLSPHRRRRLKKIEKQKVMTKTNELKFVFFSVALASLPVIINFLFFDGFYDRFLVEMAEKYLKR